MGKKRSSDNIGNSSKQAKKAKTVKNASQSDDGVKIPDMLCWGNESDGFVKTWQLITELEKRENAIVSFGKVAGEVCHPILVSTCFPESFPSLHQQNTSGDSKVKVFNQIGRAIWPDDSNISITLIGNRTKGKFTS